LISMPVVVADTSPINYLRVMREAMPNGRIPSFSAHTLRSQGDKNGLRTVLNYQQVGSTRYLDAAGFPGRTVGLKETTSIPAR